MKTLNNTSLIDLGTSKNNVSKSAGSENANGQQMVIHASGTRVGNTWTNITLDKTKEEVYSQLDAGNYNIVVELTGSGGGNPEVYEYEHHTNYYVMFHLLLCGFGSTMYVYHLQIMVDDNEFVQTQIGSNTITFNS